MRLVLYDSVFLNVPIFARHVHSAQYNTQYFGMRFTNAYAIVNFIAHSQFTHYRVTVLQTSSLSNSSYFGRRHYRLSSLREIRRVEA
jgi:hypothetical protein